MPESELGLRVWARDDGGRSRSLVYWFRPMRRPALTGSRLDFLVWEREFGSSLAGGVEKLDGGGM